MIAGAGGAGAPAIDVRGLTFRYPGTAAPVFDALSLSVPAGARVLLLGANGVGKTTLLRLIAGRSLIPAEAVRVLGRAAFHDTTLSADVALLGGAFPFGADIAVSEILTHRPVRDAGRRRRLIDLLDVDPAWRMHRVSDGQRRRVQILLDLEPAPLVALVDEVTADLDVLVRADLLDFLRSECESRGVTIVYASHVLDELDRWGTHLLYLSRAAAAAAARVRCFRPLDAVAELRGSSLGALCRAWMREDRPRDAASKQAARRG